MHIALPFAYNDAAFLHCLKACTNNKALVSNFERLHGFQAADHPKEFCEFVHESFYLTMSPEVLEEIRASALHKQ